jgi:hypothetical protein
VQVDARRRDQGGRDVTEEIDKFQRREDQIALFTARLRFRAVIVQISATFVNILQ